MCLCGAIDCPSCHPESLEPDPPVRLTECDVCGQMRPCVTGPHWSPGIETYACHVCRGDEDCEECEETV